MGICFGLSERPAELMGDGRGSGVAVCSRNDSLVILFRSLRSIRCEIGGGVDAEELDMTDGDVVSISEPRTWPLVGSGLRCL